MGKALLRVESWLQSRSSIAIPDDPYVALAQAAHDLGVDRGAFAAQVTRFVEIRRAHPATLVAALDAFDVIADARAASLLARADVELVRKPWLAVQRGYATRLAAAAAVTAERLSLPGDPSFWRDRRRAYHERVRQRQARSAPAAPPAATALLGERVVSSAGEELGTVQQPLLHVYQPESKWRPLGPWVVTGGQTSNAAPISGRVSCFAMGRFATPLYVGAANGGVWRSDDQGTTWTSMMEGFDQDTTTGANVDSLSVGALCVDPRDPERIWVGTGEGDTTPNSVHSTGRAWVNVASAFAGVGIFRRDPGSPRWIEEPATPTLLGEAIYELAVDPRQPDRIVAATTAGLYARSANGTWLRRVAGSFYSVIAFDHGGTTLFFAIDTNGVLTGSTDGLTWRTPPTGSAPFAAAPPATGTLSPPKKVPIDRYRLAVSPAGAAGARSVVYAFSARNRLTRFALDVGRVGPRRVFTLAGWSPTWLEVDSVPPVVDDQGWYDLAIAVHPDDPSIVHLGGQGEGLFTLAVTARAGGGLTATWTSIGAGIHSDVHVIALAVDQPTSMWIGCDGGVFWRAHPGVDTALHRNAGLATLMPTRLAQDADHPGLLFVGTQDNGVQRWRGGTDWDHVGHGDAGSVLLDPAGKRMLYGYVTDVYYRAPTLAPTVSSWSSGNFPGATAASNPYLFYPPVESAHACGAPGRIAVGSDRLRVSDDFGATWTAVGLGLPAGESVTALHFAAKGRILIGTDGGRVLVADEKASPVGAPTWKPSEVGGSSTFALPLVWVTDFALDLTAPGGQAFFVTFGGAGDWRHVWRYDGARPAGSRWTARSGSIHPGSTVVSSARGTARILQPVDERLLDVQVNAIVAHPIFPEQLFIGTDLGLWRSDDGGGTWSPFAEGLPDAAVVDLACHPMTGTLRAALHGRGVFERQLTGGPGASVQLYLRANTLDVARRWATKDAVDPSTGSAVGFLESPSIKVQIADSDGRFASGGLAPPWWRFANVADTSAAVPFRRGDAVTTMRVFVEVSNRTTDASEAYVILMAGPADSVAMPGWENLADNGFRHSQPMVFEIPQWKVIGTRRVEGVAAGSPQVAEFDVPANVRSSWGPGHKAVLLAFVHASRDPARMFKRPGAPDEVGEFVELCRHIAARQISLV